MTAPVRWFDDLVAVDLETTGLSPRRHRIVQAAAIRFERGVEVSRFATYVDPETDLPPGINAVDPDDLRGAPRFREVVGDLVRALLDPPAIMIYNAPFDVGFLRAELRRARRRIPADLDVDRVLDPLLWVRDVDRYARGRDRHRLTTTAERRGIEVEGEAHLAEVDCLLTMGVAASLRRDVPRTIEKIIPWQTRIRAEQLEDRREYRRRLREARA